MKTAQRAVCLLAAFAWLVGSIPLAAAQELTARNIRKIERQAAKETSAGRGAKAIELYEQLLEGTEAGNPSRATALYEVLSAEMAQYERMTPKGEDLLEELLTTFPEHPRKMEIQFFRRWRDQRLQLVDQTSQLGDLRQRLIDQEASCEAMKGELSGAAGEKEEELSRDVQRLRRQLTTAKEELAATRAELQVKEEALEKLKNALVGGGT